MATRYLLDTPVLLHWLRGKKQAEVIEHYFQLETSPFKPLVCIVSLGEMRAFSRSQNWGAERKKRLDEIEKHLIVIDIRDQRLLDAYADISTLAKKSGWSLFHGKNDLWVAAAAKASDSHLLTMDKDFLPLQRVAGWAITILDDKTAVPLV